jgi:quercetin dioxygenase-like cupin family protein
MKKIDRPGMSAAVVHGEGLSFARWEMERGADLADHSHPHAQITYIIKGRVRFRRAGNESFTAAAGDFLIFEPNEVHGGEVLEDSLVVDAFCPVREDFRKESGWQD